MRDLVQLAMERVGMFADYLVFARSGIWLSGVCCNIWICWRKLPHLVSRPLLCGRMQPSAIDNGYNVYIKASRLAKNMRLTDKIIWLVCNCDKTAENGFFESKDHPPPLPQIVHFLDRDKPVAGKWSFVERLPCSAPQILVIRHTRHSLRPCSDMTMTSTYVLCVAVWCADESANWSL